MRSRSLTSILVVAAVLAVLGATAYFSRGTWKPWLAKRLSPEDTPKAAGADPHAGHDHAAHGDRVKLGPQAQANLKLVVEPLIPESYTRTLLIPGMVVDRPGVSDRGVTTPVAGVVTELKVHPGDTVKPGDPLVTVRIVSELLQNVQGDLFKAAKDLQIAGENLKLLRAAPPETIAGTRIIEAENQERRARTTVSALRQQLLAHGLRAEQIDAAAEGRFVTELTVSAPVLPGAGRQLVAADAKAASADVPAAGPTFEVKELKPQLGEQLTAGQVVCLLANHRLLYIEGRAFKSEAAGLARAAKEGWKVEAEFAEEANAPWPAVEPLTIRHLSNAVDPGTRTFAFFLPLQNQSETYEKDGKTYFVWRFRPGQRVRLQVPLEKLGDDVFVLPAGAVVHEGAEAFVFRQNGDLFERKPVHVLYEDRTHVILANDGSVGAGQYVVRNQAAALNRAIKAAAGGGGGHEGHDHAH